MCWLCGFENTVNHFDQQEVLDRASALACEGEEQVEMSHYSEDSIRPKCTDLRSAGEDVSSSFKAKKDHLLKALELHHHLEKVSVQIPKTLKLFSLVDVIPYRSFLFTCRRLSGAMRAYTC